MFNVLKFVAWHNNMHIFLWQRFKYKVKFNNSLLFVFLFKFLSGWVKSGWKSQAFNWDTLNRSLYSE